MTDTLSSFDRLDGETAITQSDAGAESCYNCPRMHTTRDDSRFMYSSIEAASEGIE